MPNVRSREDGNMSWCDMLTTCVGFDREAMLGASGKHARTAAGVSLDAASGKTAVEFGRTGDHREARS